MPAMPMRGAHGVVARAVEQVVLTVVPVTQRSTNG
jgi:hypothetical protein